MPYELINDGKSIPLGDRKYLLSPQDLVGLEILPEIIRSGVASLKIEGRLKTPEYVAKKGLHHRVVWTKGLSAKCRSQGWYMSLLLKNNHQSNSQVKQHNRLMSAAHRTQTWRNKSAE
jgi:putative protease